MLQILGSQALTRQGIAQGNLCGQFPTERMFTDFNRTTMTPDVSWKVSDKVFKDPDRLGFVLSSMPPGTHIPGMLVPPVMSWLGGG
jgi:hypothetical protein